MALFEKRWRLHHTDTVPCDLPAGSMVLFRVALGVPPAPLMIFRDLSTQSSPTVPCPLEVGVYFQATEIVGLWWRFKRARGWL